MMSSPSFQSPHGRTRRKLPNIQKRGQEKLQDATTVFWYSYHSALQWIQSHEDVISKCVELLQLYPNLIQDESMDRFWEFIHPLVHPQQTEVKDSKVSSDPGAISKAGGTLRNQSKTVASKGQSIPHISVTESADSPRPSFTISAKHARTPRVHLISQRHNGSFSDNKRFLHFGVLDMLQGDFYVRVANSECVTSMSDVNQSTTTSSKSDRHYVIAESDVCVYLFDDATLNDQGCFHDLCVALTHKIPVVYVRYHNKEFPKTFSETIRTNSHGCITLQDYVEKFMKEKPSSNLSPSSKKLRTKHKLSPLICKTRPSSAREMNVKSLETRRNKRRHSPILSEVDLVFTLVSNFKNACVFDENDLEDCSVRLKQTIHQVLGIYEAKSELPSVNTSLSVDMDASDDSLSSPDSAGKNNRLYTKSSKKTPPSANSSTSSGSPENSPTFLNVPSQDDIISAREWGNSGSVSAPPYGLSNGGYDSDTKNFFFNNDVRMATPPVLEQKPTTYLIFDRQKTPDGPRRVEFPPRHPDENILDSDLDSDDFDPIASPITFNEVDLSREINARGTPESDISNFSYF